MKHVLRKISCKRPCITSSICKYRESLFNVLHLPQCVVVGSLMNCFAKLMLLPLLFQGCGKVDTTSGAPAEAGPSTTDGTNFVECDGDEFPHPTRYSNGRVSELPGGGPQPAPRPIGGHNPGEPQKTTSKQVENVVQLTGGKSVTVRGSLFTGGHKRGDFNWMIKQSEYAKTLFVFNDNQEQYDAFIGGDKGGAGCGKGSGNGVMRPFQCRSPQRVAGVPTGIRGQGYPKLTNAVKAKIDDAITRIRALATSGDFDTVIFSQENENGRATLGAGIYKKHMGMDVREYIFSSLLRLAPGA